MAWALAIIVAVVVLAVAELTPTEHDGTDYADDHTDAATAAAFTDRRTRLGSASARARAMHDRADAGDPEWYRADLGVRWTPGAGR